MAGLDHIILFLLLFFSFYIVSLNKQSYVEKYYWRVMLIPIILYTFVLGCRYGWGNDYLWYKQRIENPYYFMNESYGFQIINLFLKAIGLNYVGVYMVYSLLYIVAGLSFVKTYNGNKFMPILFVIANYHFQAYCIRQAVAHAFVLFSLSFFNKKNWVGVLIIIPIVLSVHSAAILTLLVCVIAYYLTSKPISYKISIPVYIFVAVFSLRIAIVFSTYFPEYIALLSVGDDALAHYTEQSERWFGENAIMEEFFQSIHALLLTTVFAVGILYIGGMSLKYSPSRIVTYGYNVTAVGLILQKFFGLFEILLRISSPLMFMYVIPLGYSIYFYKYKSFMLNPAEKRNYKISLFGIVTYLVLFQGRELVFPKLSGFIWNI